MAEREDRDRESEFNRIADGVIRGEPAACEELMKKYTLPFYGQLISKWHCSPHTAEDLTNEALAEILKELLKEARDGRGGEKKTAWGYAILENKACDHLRDKKRRKALSLEAMQEQGEEPRDKDAETPSAKVMLKEAEGEIARARRIWEEEYAKIGGETRKLLDLLRAGLSVAEIARRTKKNYHTCHTLIKRAQDRLVEIVHARLAGVPPPEPLMVMRETLEAAIKKLPLDRRDIAGMACLDRMSLDAISRKAGCSRDSIESTLVLIWIDLSKIFHRDFPEALEFLKKKGRDS